MPHIIEWFHNKYFILFRSQFINEFKELKGQFTCTSETKCIKVLLLKSNKIKTEYSTNVMKLIEENKADCAII